MSENLTNIQKAEYIAKLTDELLMLRAKANITQEKLANLAGISRQTYYAIETKKREMSWNTYLSLLFIYDNIPETSLIIRKLEIFPSGLLEEVRGGSSENKTASEINEEENDNAL